MSKFSFHSFLLLSFLFLLLFLSLFLSQRFKAVRTIKSPSALMLFFFFTEFKKRWGKGQGYMYTQRDKKDWRRDRGEQEEKRRREKEEERYPCKLKMFGLSMKQQYPGKIETSNQKIKGRKSRRHKRNVW